MSSPLRLIVTGMHRSATSFVASLLSAWNIRMGDRLLPPDRGNPAGYFEDVDFLDLDRRILIACTLPEEGHRDWGWTESATFDTAPLPSFRGAAEELIAERDRAGQAWAFKDPRASMLLDFWDESVGGEARFLLLYRHPWEVADSMLRTGAAVWLTHPDYPARIWTQYNRRILDFHLRHRDRTLLVSANRLLEDPSAFVTALRERFGIGAHAETVAALRAKGSFVSMPDDDPLPRLWHYAHPEAMDLLGTLDDAADLGNDRRWEAAFRAIGPRSAERPRLSVIIPCRDDGEYLIDAVASVERNAPAAELIVIDDGSTQPRTREVLAALRDAGHRIIEQPNAGIAAARNSGIAASSGEYFLPLDADNRLLPGFAAEALTLLDANPAAGVVFGDRREFGAHSGDVTVPELDLPRMLWSNLIDACAVVRRDVWSQAGGYDVAFHDWEDWDFWLSAAERGWEFVRRPGPAFEYRVRPGSVHHRFLSGSDYIPTLHRIYEKHRDLVTQYAPRILEAAHAERRQLLRDVQSLREARDALQTTIDRVDTDARQQIAGLQNIIRARDEELASVKFVLEAREQELAARRDPLPAVESPEGPLTEAAQVFTIVARNYLPHARVLAASLARHNPQTRLNVVVLDDLRREIAREPSMEIIHPSELPFDPPADFYTMAAIYDVTELATAVKPWVFEHLFARGASVVIYLDPDIEVFDSLGPLEGLARTHRMVLTPHITAPLPRDGQRPDERDVLMAGIYNLGFLALSAETAKTFIPWWGERLRRDCLNDPAAGLFVDQRWIDFAPGLFEPYILRDSGYNVAYWNLPHRVLEWDGDRIVVDGRPLRFFHYSGFSPGAPHLLSKHQHDSQRIRLSEAPLVAALCARYAAALEEAGFDSCSSLPYGFATTASGLPLELRTRRVLRRTYLEDEAGGQSSFPNPFSSEGADDVVERLRRPSPHSPLVSGWLGEIWSERPDLRIAFPRIDSTDAQRFLEWVRTQGVREHEIPSPLVPHSTSAAAAPSRRESLTPGVNVYGYAFAESGTGQIVRSVVSALAAEGIPYAVVPFTRTLSRQQRTFHDLGTAVPTFDTNLICVNADQVPLFFATMGSRLPRGARNIGLWAWEVEDLPAALARSERDLDEVWGISSFTSNALARSLTRPVRAFPLPVIVPQVQRRTRADLGMPEGFLFLFCFDYDSVFRRKNPLAAIAAFRRAFGDRRDVVLFIKTTNAGRHVAEDEELRAAASGRPNIVIRDGYVTTDRYFSMLDACDCYVSLHRSEGFGLTVAEAMALGKPVITTAYSSTLEFANESNSFSVPARMVPIGDGAPPYPSQSHWAEPDVDVAARQMMRVYVDRAGAEAVGARARADIQTLHGPSARGPLLRRLIDESRQAPYETKESVSIEKPQSSAEVPGGFDSEAMAAESLLGSPTPDLPSRIQRIVRPLRRLVLRCIRVYWVQQLAIDRAILGAMRMLRRETRGEIAAHAAMIERQDAETARMRERLAGLTADVGALRDRVGSVAAMRSEEDRTETKDLRPSMK
ncbi:MAG TPA: glycosyltransferase [Thermoanaerobaculia bacterium]|nr:glycosyltransferase [Thermoanaerobaculia bacterium]